MQCPYHHSAATARATGETERHPGGPAPGSGSGSGPGSGSGSGPGSGSGSPSEGAAAPQRPMTYLAAMAEALAEQPDYNIFENKTGLAEDLKFLASMPELCDVTFLVGDTREPVCAVKAVLASRSRSVRADSRRTDRRTNRRMDRRSGTYCKTDARQIDGHWAAGQMDRQVDGRDIQTDGQKD